MVSSTEKESDISASVSASFIGIANGNANFKHVSNLENLTVQALALGGEKSDAIDAVKAGIQGLNSFLETLDRGAQINQAVPLSYAIRSVKSDKVVRQGINTSFEVKDCSPLSEKVLLSKSIIDYGIVCMTEQNQEALTRNLTITNNHSTTLTLNVKQNFSGSSSVFEVCPLNQLVISPNENKDIIIRYKNKRCGTWWGCRKRTEHLDVSYTISGVESKISIPLIAGNSLSGCN